MEVNCPQCSQRLRVPDGLQNPLLRCRSCAQQFRLQDATALAGSRAQLPSEVPSQTRSELSPAPMRAEFSPAPTSAPVPAQDDPLQEFLKQNRPPSASMTDKARSFGRGSMGTVALVIALIAVKGGVRLASNLFRDRQPERRPVQMNEEERRAAQRLFQDLEQQIARERALKEPGFRQLPELPDVPPPPFGPRELRP